MRNARLFGIVFLFIGLPLSWLYLSSINEIGATLKILLVVPFIVGISIGMIVFPGYTLTKEEWKIKEQRLKIIFSKTKMLNIIAWIVLGILGIVLVKLGLFDSFFLK